MKTTIAVLLGGIVLLGSGINVPGEEQPAQEKALGPGDHSLRIKVGTLERRYIVHVPPSYGGKTPVAVVIMFHGGGGTAKGAMRQTGWTEKADQSGFLAAFPEAISRDPSRPARFKGNPQIWNDGSGRGHAGRRNIDDVGFTSALIDFLESRFAVDERRIYATGFSNGASMTFRVGVELSERIAAIAPVSGHFWLKSSELSRPVPLIYLIGTEDPLNPLEGGQIRMANGRMSKKPLPRESVLSWAKMLGCPQKSELVYDKEGVKGTAYRPCKEKSEVIVYTIEGMGHTWPGGISRLPEWMVGKTTRKLNANDVIWDFFQKHPKS